MLRLGFFISISLCFHVAFAHKGPLDELGCHTDPSTKSYHCHSGHLAGREFLNREAAESMMAAMRAESETELEAAAESAPTPFKASDVDVPSEQTVKVITWNAKSFGRPGFDYDRTASVLADADVVVLQSLTFVNGASDPLVVLAGLVNARTHERVCKAWVKLPGSKERHGYIWKEHKLGIVTDRGELKGACEEAPVRLEARSEPVRAVFFSKTQSRLFGLASIAHDTKPKRAAAAVLSQQKALAAQGWPVIVVGNYQINPADKVFKHKDTKFKSVLSRRRAPFDGIWYRDMRLLMGSAASLKERFPKLSADAIKRTLPDVPPVAAQFAFGGEADDDQLEIQNVKKKDTGGKTPASAGKPVKETKMSKAAAKSKKPKFETYTHGAKMLEDEPVGEDLNDEVKDAEAAAK